MKKFSALIAHYNNYEYFLACLKSLENQTFRDIEIVIVDDHSSDGSFEKISTLLKEKLDVKIVQNDINSGVGFTKNRCVAIASGEFCGFIDPDDALTPNAVEDAVKNYDAETVAVYSGFQMCDNELNFLKNFPNSAQVKNNNPLFFNINLEVNHFFTFRKSAYDETNGINPELTSAVDQDLYMKLYEKGNFKYIPSANYLYRLHEKGVSQDKAKKEKLNKNWHRVISESCERRKISNLYGKKIAEIENLPEFIFKKQNTLFSKILRKLS